MEELDLKNKIAIFGIGMIFLYIFVLLPLEKTFEVKNEIENYNKKIYVSSKKIKEVEKQLDEKLEEFEKLENSIINLEEKNLYDFIMNLKKSDIEELLKSSKTEEEKKFYYKLQELILRIQQEKLIAEGVF